MMKNYLPNVDIYLLVYIHSIKLLFSLGNANVTEKASQNSDNYKCYITLITQLRTYRNFYAIKLPKQVIHRFNILLIQYLDKLKSDLFTPVEESNRFLGLKGGIISK